MGGNKKLKPVPISVVVILHVFILSIFILLRIIYGEDMIFLIGAGINLVISFWSFYLVLRTKNFYFTVLFLFFFFLMVANLIRIYYSVSVAEYFLFIAILFGIWTCYILFTKKIKSRIAKPVCECSKRIRKLFRSKKRIH